MSMTKRSSKRILFVLAALVLIVGCAIAIPLFFSGNGAGTGGGGGIPSLIEKQEEPEQPISLEILCVGDVMAHGAQIKAQYNSSDGTYDFTNNFKYVKDYISAADLALCNVETTFAGEPYSGYPNFAAPDALADALKDAGFDVAMTANNHMLDRGKSGLLRTLEVLRAKGFATTGSIYQTDEARYAMSEVKGLKIATVAYTYETTNNNGRVAINGGLVPEETAALINSFSYQRIDTDLAEIASVVSAAREAGADIVILYMHWGEEYQKTANDWQRTLASRIANEMDVDMIFASHPHNLQEAEMYTKTLADGSTKQIPVFYSMGNFISNQRTETLGAGYADSETGCLAIVDLEYMASTDEVSAITMKALPVWVDKYSDGVKNVYELIPLDENLAANATLAVSGHLQRAEKAKEAAYGLLKLN